MSPFKKNFNTIGQSQADSMFCDMCYNIITLIEHVSEWIIGYCSSYIVQKPSGSDVLYSRSFSIQSQSTGEEL